MKNKKSIKRVELGDDLIALNFGEQINDREAKHRITKEMNLHLGTKDEFDKIFEKNQEEALSTTPIVILDGDFCGYTQDFFNQNEVLCKDTEQIKSFNKSQRTIRNLINRFFDRAKYPANIYFLAKRN